MSVWYAQCFLASSPFLGISYSKPSQKQFFTFQSNTIVPVAAGAEARERRLGCGAQTGGWKKEARMTTHVVLFHPGHFPRSPVTAATLSQMRFLRAAIGAGRRNPGQGRSGISRVKCCFIALEWSLVMGCYCQTWETWPDSGHMCYSQV